MNIDSILKLPIQEAYDKLNGCGVKYRIVVIDGKYQLASADYVADRINLVVDKGIVVSYTRG